MTLIISVYKTSPSLERGGNLYASMKKKIDGFLNKYNISRNSIQCVTYFYTTYHLFLYHVSPIHIHLITVDTSHHLIPYNASRFIQCITYFYTTHHVLYNVSHFFVQRITFFYTMYHVFLYNVSPLQENECFVIVD